MSAEEYLAFEAAAERRHEFQLGCAFLMPDVTVSHNIVAGNIGAELHTQLRGKPCRVFMSQVKCRIMAAQTANFYYPDVMVACDPTDNAEFWRERPSVIFEVLLPGSARTDFDKFFVYQHIATLQLYVVVEPDHPLVTTFQRTEEGWQRSNISDLAAEVPIDSIGCKLSLAQIYEDIDFAAAK